MPKDCGPRCHCSLLGQMPLELSHTPHYVPYLSHIAVSEQICVSLCLSLCLSQVTKVVDHESYLTMSTFIMNEGSSQAAPHHDMPCPFPATISLCPCWLF